MFLASAAGADPMLRMVGFDAAGGGAEFVIEAWLLRRRMRQHIGRFPGGIWRSSPQLAAIQNLARY